ncbi:MAG: DUF3501 family protein [Myxococcales bacterium]|nr:DUF3501 family protein [Myxococcales bacterium]
MRSIRRDELLELGAYEAIRSRFTARIIQSKKRRRISVGDHLTFVFENRDTALFQIQEMIRIERITRESAIQHELETYQSLVPGEGELFATLFIEYEDPVARREALDAMTELRSHVRLQIGSASHAGTFEPVPGERDDMLPAVNYIRFRPGREAAAKLRDPAIACQLEITHPFYPRSAELDSALRSELAEDLDER